MKHLFTLEQNDELNNTYKQRLEVYDLQIEKHLQQFEAMASNFSYANNSIANTKSIWLQLISVQFCYHLIVFFLCQ